LIYSHL